MTNTNRPLRVLAIANQKGGVGKTTTAINLGAALAAVGEKVLILDLDPQGNASTGVGIAEDARPVTSFDVLIGKTSIAKASMLTLVPNLSVVAASADLRGLESEMMAGANRPFHLRKAVAALLAEQRANPGQVPYNYLLIDCPPSRNLLTLNAMVAAHAVLVPVQCEFFALEGISQLRDTIEQIKATLNPSLDIQGVVLTMHDGSTTLSKQVANEVRAFFGPKVYETIIRRDYRVIEASAHRMPAVRYEDGCFASADYTSLATEFCQKERDIRSDETLFPAVQPGASTTVLSEKGPRSISGMRMRTYRCARADGVPAQKALAVADEQLRQHQTYVRKADREYRRQKRMEARFDRGDTVWVKRIKSTATGSWESAKIVEPTRNDWRNFTECLAHFYVVRFDSDGERFYKVLDEIFLRQPEENWPKPYTDPTAPYAECLDREATMIEKSQPEKIIEKHKVVPTWLLCQMGAGILVLGAYMYDRGGGIAIILGIALLSVALGRSISRSPRFSSRVPSDPF